MALVRERYADFGPTLARGKLIEPHWISVAKETLRQWMAKAGIWVSRRERKNRFSSHADLMFGIRDGSTANAHPKRGRKPERALTKQPAAG